VSRELAGRHVLVTGGSRGIGYAVAAAFLDEDARVTLLAEGTDVHAAAARLGAARGRPVGAVQCDITDRAALRTALEPLSPIDVLVANAGTGDITPIDGPAPSVDELFERLIRVNLIGAFNTVRAALPRMPSGGRIVFTSSVHGHGIAPPAMSGYAASKGGLEALVRSLARELGPRGITVNAVAPGMVATELTLGAIRKLFAAQLSGHDAPPEEEMVRRLNETQAIHRAPVDAARLAAAYVFLATDAGAAITGQSLRVDHGLCMG
jgi:3-hydroxybutyrate dehydrogenase